MLIAGDASLTQNVLMSLFTNATAFRFLDWKAIAIAPSSVATYTVDFETFQKCWADQQPLIYWSGAPIMQWKTDEIILYILHTCVQSS